MRESGKSTNYFEFGNINFSSLNDLAQEYIIVGKNIYLQNKKPVNFILCIVCFVMIMLQWLDLSLISNLYFLGLIYMTVRITGTFYNKIPTLETKFNDGTYIQQGIESLDQKQSHKMLAEFSSISCNWLTYSSLILCDWILQTINSIIGTGLSPVVQIIRFLLYMQYCREFIKSLEPYCKDLSHNEVTYISDELAKNILLSIYAKHLINLMSINNVFCINLFARANLKVLTFIDNCSSSGIDILSNIACEFLKHASKAKTLSSNAVQNTLGNLHFIQKLKSFIISNEYTKKSD